MGKVNTGSVNFHFAGANIGSFGTSYSEITLDFVASTTTTSVRFSGFGAGQIINIDYWNLEELVTEIVNTNLPDIFKDGDILTSLFDGAVQRINVGSYNDLTGDISYLCWFKAYSQGEVTNGTLFDNGKFQIRTGGGYRIYVYTDGSTLRFSAQNVITARDQYYFLAVVREASGLTTLWINDTLIMDRLSNGDPDPGTTAMMIGNNFAGGRTWDGIIADSKALSGLLTAEEISQYYTATKHLYQK
jgi:hypothetical protein